MPSKQQTKWEQRGQWRRATISHNVTVENWGQGERVRIEGQDADGNPVALHTDLNTLKAIVEAIEDDSDQDIADYEDQQSKLIMAHEEEARSQGAEFYNLGWAQGETFIHSKTDQGRLYTEIDADGNTTHKWER